MNYVVRPGDSLYRIASTHGLTVTALHRANPDLQYSELYVGQTVSLPTPLRVYSVRNNDSLYQIAIRLQVSVAQLLAQNPSLRERPLVVGERLLVPDQRHTVVNHIQHTSLHHTVPYPDQETLLKAQGARYEYVTMHIVNGRKAFTRRQRGSVGQKAQNHAHELHQVQEALRMQGMLDPALENNWYDPQKPDEVVSPDAFPATWAALEKFQDEHALAWWAEHPVFGNVYFTPHTVYPDDLTSWALRYATRYQVQLEDLRSELHDLYFQNFQRVPEVKDPLGVAYPGTVRTSFDADTLRHLEIHEAHIPFVRTLLERQYAFDTIASHFSSCFAFGCMLFSGKLLTRFLVNMKLRHPALFDELFARFGIEVEYSWTGENLDTTTLMLLLPDATGSEFVVYDEAALREIQRDKRLQAIFIRAGLDLEAAKIQVFTLYQECLKPLLEKHAPDTILPHLAQKFDGQLIVREI